VASLRPAIFLFWAYEGFCRREFARTDAASGISTGAIRPRDAGSNPDELRDAVAESGVQLPGAKVLEIGCGTGALTEKMIARGARVTAVDQNPEMIERARISHPMRSRLWNEQPPR
jgi:2-polyprenyl-3-methyl-5-hydroxy-6-metoxy-1,4-benzoquinol methylase